MLQVSDSVQLVELAELMELVEPIEFVEPGRGSRAVRPRMDLVELAEPARW